LCGPRVCKCSPCAKLEKSYALLFCLGHGKT
jgi:hypothetical protein